MKAARVRFYAELNDLLTPERRARDLEHQFQTEPSVKDVIESCGVPHTEVDLVLVNGSSVAFDHRVGDGDQVSVYPVFEAIDITPVLKVRPKPLREPRFVLDTHLGKLARYLRMLGFDTLFANDTPDAELARISNEQRRILLTRDRGLLMRSLVTHGSYVRAVGARRQLVEVIQRFDLARGVRPFTRCMKCNGLLRVVEKESVIARVPLNVREHRLSFQECQGCRRLYWEGSHHERMRQLIAESLRQAELS